MAVRMVGKGMTVFGRQEEAPATPLSDREREVLTLIASGATNREIAERLYLSPHTVKEHASALYRKLGVKNRAEATRRAERLGSLAEPAFGALTPARASDPPTRRPPTPGWGVADQLGFTARTGCGRCGA